MLERYRAALLAEPEPVRSRVSIECGDMRDFSLGVSFDCVAIPWHAFQYLLTLEDQLSCLACIRRHLTPRGRLILPVQMWSRPAADKPPAPTDWPLVDGGSFELSDGRSVEIRGLAVRDATDPSVSIAVRRCEVTDPSGAFEALTEEYPTRVVSVEEIGEVLNRSGFRVVQRFGGYDCRPFDASTSRDAIFIATR